MKSKNGAILLIITLLSLALLVSGCGCGKVSSADIDYGDAESFETMLNSGEKMDGKVVQFVAEKVTSGDSAYNIWGGEHLNFMSNSDPQVNNGDKVVVKVNSVKNKDGKWFIYYDRVETGQITDKTLTKESPSIVEKNKKLAIKESEWHVTNRSSNAYVLYTALVVNENQSLIAENAKLKITVKSKEGTVLGTKEEYLVNVFPSDTVPVSGRLEIASTYSADNIDVQFDLECSGYVTSITTGHNVRTSDFQITNISEQHLGREEKITGEVKNNSQENVLLKIVYILRKDGKIVYSDYTYLTSIDPGANLAFETSTFSAPEHDSIECFGTNAL